MTKRFGLLASVALMSGCAAATTLTPMSCGTPTDRTPALDQTFNIRYGDQATVAGQDLTVTFDRVLEDSRCPEPVMCLVAGVARIAVAAERPPDPAAVLDLSTFNVPSTIGSYGGYTVQLVDLIPHPVDGRTVSATGYCAELKVSQGGPQPN